jgi:hypothetical protein
MVTAVVAVLSMLRRAARNGSSRMELIGVKAWSWESKQLHFRPFQTVKKYLS